MFLRCNGTLVTNVNVNKSQRQIPCADKKGWFSGVFDALFRFTACRKASVAVETTLPQCERGCCKTLQDHSVESGCTIQVGASGILGLNWTLVSPGRARLCTAFTVNQLCSDIKGKSLCVCRYVSKTVRLITEHAHELLPHKTNWFCKKAKNVPVFFHFSVLQSCKLHLITIDLAPAKR